MSSDPSSPPIRRSAGLAAVALVAALVAPPATAQALCSGFGPQTPRDISARDGTNAVSWTPAPVPAEMNLCNIHTHTHAEHRGPGFQVSAGAGEHGGFACNAADSLTEAERAPVEHPHFGGVAPGDTIEVHWVFSSCNVQPGPGLGACLSESCANPELRVEAQVFLLVNDPAALDFAGFDLAEGGARPQPAALPSGTGAPVVFLGSTTGPSYNDQVCSPLQVTWSVRPDCAKLDINSLHRWAAEGNRFDEHHSHGVRQLVTAPDLLSRID